MGVRLRLRWWELAPEAVLAAGLGLFALTEWDAAYSGLRSAKAFVLMAAVGAAWLVGRVLAAAFVPWTLARVAVFALAAAAVLNIVVLPSYRDDTKVEVLADAAEPPSGAPAPSTSTSVAVAAGPVRLRTGALAGIDHRASGTASLYRRADGSYAVGLERFDIQPGPDYDVYVVPGPAKRSKAGGVRLDDLRANKGTQFYDVPRSVDLAAGEWTVLVWCQTFGVPVAHATPA